MVGGNRWIWVVAIVDVGCGHGSDSEWSMGVKGEREREVLSLEKLNNFF